MRSPFLKANRKAGFTLVEVVLAIGVLSFAVLSLVMMFGPTMKSVRTVIASKEALAAVPTINAYLQSYAQQSTTNFETNLPNRLNAATATSATANKSYYVFAIATNASNTTSLRQAKVYETSSDAATALNTAVAGGTLLSGVLRVELWQMRDPTNTGNAMSLYSNLSNEAYLPFIVKIFAIPTQTTANDLSGSTGIEILSYNTAVLR